MASNTRTIGIGSSTAWRALRRGPLEGARRVDPDLPGGRLRGHDVVPSGGTITCAKDMRIEAKHAFVDAPAIDVLIHPGGQGTRPLMVDEDHLQFRRRRDDALLGRSWPASAPGHRRWPRPGCCTTALLITHWASLDLLAETDPTSPSTARRASSTTATCSMSLCVSAGIDLALHLVVRLASRLAAPAAVLRGIEYDPDPPGRRLRAGSGPGHPRRWVRPTPR